MRPFIVVGDRTDHGGTVVQGDPSADINGKPIARIGDQVACPKRGHGMSTIVTGDPTIILDGRPAARHGDKCSCGATLLSSQVVTFASEGHGASSAYSLATRNPPVPPESVARMYSTPAPASDFDEQVELISDHAMAVGLPYFIKVGSRTLAGRVGPDGRLPRIDTPTVDEYTVYVGDDALASTLGVQA